MDFHNTDDSLTRRVRAFTDRVGRLKENDLYFFNTPVTEILPGMKVRVNSVHPGIIETPMMEEAMQVMAQTTGEGGNVVKERFASSTRWAAWGVIRTSPMRSCFLRQTRRRS